MPPNADPVTEAAEAEWMRKRQRDPLRTRRRRAVDDSTVDWSRDPFIAAWERWDAKPDDVGRTGRLEDLVRAFAADLGQHSSFVREAMAAGRRAGLDRAVIRDRIRAGA